MSSEVRHFDVHVSLSLQESVQMCKQPKTEHMVFVFFLVLTLHRCMNTPSERENDPTLKHTFGCFGFFWDCIFTAPTVQRPGPVLASLELLHCADVWVAGTTKSPPVYSFNSHTTCTYLDIVCVFLSCVAIDPLIYF